MTPSFTRKLRLWFTFDSFMRRSVAAVLRANPARPDFARALKAFTREILKMDDLTDSTLRWTLDSALDDVKWRALADVLSAELGD